MFRIKSRDGNKVFPGGLAAKSFVSYAGGYGVRVSEDEARKLRDGWFEAFPEMRSHLQPPADAVDPEWFIGRTTTGRMRAKASYTEASNTPFQGLAADGAKLALWRLFREGFRIVNFIHDEVVVELDDDDPARMSARVDAIREIMRDEMRRVVPDVLIDTEAALMDRWVKGAKSKRGDDGVWTVNRYPKPGGGDGA